MSFSNPHFLLSVLSPLLSLKPAPTLEVMVSSPLRFGVAVDLTPWDLLLPSLSWYLLPAALSTLLQWLVGWKRHSLPSPHWLQSLLGQSPSWKWKYELISQCQRWLFPWKCFLRWHFMVTPNLITANNPNEKFRFVQWFGLNPKESCKCRREEISIVFYEALRLKTELGSLWYYFPSKCASHQTNMEEVGNRCAPD